MGCLRSSTLVIQCGHAVYPLAPNCEPDAPPAVGRPASIFLPGVAKLLGNLRRRSVPAPIFPQEYLPADQVAEMLRVPEMGMRGRTID